MTPVVGTELIAELPQRELDAAVGELVPPALIAGEDAQTPHHARVYRRARERGSALVWDFPTRTLRSELRESARALSRRGQRTIVWDAWPSATLVEYVAGEQTSLLDRGHAGGWRGTSWMSIADGEARVPFGEALLYLLREHRDSEFGAALLDDLYGLTRAPVLLATFHRPFAIAREADALAPLLRAVIARAIRDGQTEVRGLGTFVSDAGPPRTFRHYFQDGSIDLRAWSAALTPEERSAASQALRHLIDRIAPGVDEVVPGLACFHAWESVAYSGTNPRTGELVEIPSVKRVGVTLISAT